MVLPNKFELSTDVIEPKLRNEWWRSVSKAIYTVTPANNEQEAIMTGYVRSQPFGRLVVGTTAFNTQFAHRDRLMIARDDKDLYLVQLLISGDYCADFGHTNTMIRSGDIFILDLSQPLESLKLGGSRITIAIPRIDMKDFIKSKNIHGVVFRRELPSTNLLKQYILGIHDMNKDLNSSEVETIQESLLSLISIIINGNESSQLNKENLQSTLRRRVIDYIDENLDQEISIISIMKRFRVSRSHLYRAFALDGGIVTLFQNKKLDLAFRMLADKKKQNSSIKEIAYNCGFSNVNNFTRLFKARFGVTPKDVRNVPIFSGVTTDTALMLHQSLSKFF